MRQDLRDMVKASGLTYEQIAFGAGVTLSWLSKFMAGRIADPGVGRYDKVFGFLRARAKLAGSEATPEQLRPDVFGPAPDQAEAA